MARVPNRLETSTHTENWHKVKYYNMSGDEEKSQIYVNIALIFMENMQNPF